MKWEFPPHDLGALGTHFGSPDWGTTMSLQCQYNGIVIKFHNSAIVTTTLVSKVTGTVHHIAIKLTPMRADIMGRLLLAGGALHCTQ